MDASPPAVEVQGVEGGFFTNWAKTYTCRPECYFTPRSRGEIVQILHQARDEGRHVRVLGKSHSPSDLQFTPDYLLLMTHFNKVLHIDKDNCLVKVEPGAEIRDINSILESTGLSLSVLGSVADISIGGAISTGTHGTGANFGSLSTYVTEMELIKADGEQLVLSRESHKQLFRAACVSFGCLGIIVSLTIQCEPLFYLHKTVSPAPLDKVLSDLNQHLKASDHFRFLWFPYSEAVLVHELRCDERKKWSKPAPSWFWDYGIGYHLLQFLYWIATFCGFLVPTINRVYYGLLHSSKRELVDVSYKVFSFECLFNQYVTEWAIPWEKTGDVLRELRKWFEFTRFPAHFPVEVRFAREDDLLLSPAVGRKTCFINIVDYRPYGKYHEHHSYFKIFEDIMKLHGGRPHWAKDFDVTPDEFAKMYPDWETFCQIRKNMDPTNMFVNSKLRRVFGRFL